VIDVAFAEERYEDILDEIVPMHYAHWIESGEYKSGFIFNMKYDRFISNNKTGFFRLYTARSGVILVGYIGVYVSQSMHTDNYVATEDTFYILRKYRLGDLAKNLLKYVESELSKLTPISISVSLAADSRLSNFLIRLGYKCNKQTFNKVI
jgi:hypothetical protein